MSEKETKIPEEEIKEVIVKEEFPKVVLSRKQIMKSTDLKKKLIDIPEWGGSVWIQEMTGEQRILFDKWVIANNEAQSESLLRLIVATAVDEEGKLLFTDLDIPDLMKLSAVALERLSDTGAELSGMGYAIRGMVKNSVTVPKEG